MPPEADAATPTRSRLAATVRLREATLQYIGVLSVLLILIVVFSLLQPQFHTWTNALNILQTNAVLLIVSVGLTFVLLVGGFDLSIGGVLALSGVFVAELLGQGVGTISALVIVVVGGILIGIVFNGYPIARLGANFFMITLGVSFATRGIALVITGGESKGLYENQLLRNIGNGQIGQFGYLIFISLGILALATVVTRYSGFGRMIYAVGGNSEAARLAGINVVWIRISAYAISRRARRARRLPRGRPPRRRGAGHRHGDRVHGRRRRPARRNELRRRRRHDVRHVPRRPLPRRPAERPHHLEHLDLLPERDHGSRPRPVRADRPLPPVPRGRRRLRRSPSSVPRRRAVAGSSTVHVSGSTTTP